MATKWKKAWWDGYDNEAVMDLCVHYNVPARERLELRHILRERENTFGDDLCRLWINMDKAANPLNVLAQMRRQMQDETFGVWSRPKVKPRGSVQRQVQKEAKAKMLMDTEADAKPRCT